MTIYERIESAKKEFSLNNRILGEVIGTEGVPDQPVSLRPAFQKARRHMQAV